MRSQQRSFIGGAVALAWAVVLGFVSLGPVPAYATGPRVEICHFQRAKGTWKLKSQGQRAARHHLENHDDALPGGVTSQTFQKLDEACIQVEARCACEGAEWVGVRWDDSFHTVECRIIEDDPDGILRMVLFGAGGNEPVLEYEQDNMDPQVENECRITTNVPQGQALWGAARAVTPIGFRPTCEESLRQIAANDGVSCVLN